MNDAVEFPARPLEADAFVRGEGHRRISLREFRGTWVVLALCARRSEVLDLAAHEEAFAADGAVVLASTPADRDTVAGVYADEPVRFPILCEVDESPVTMVVDPDGLVRYVGGPQTARELLATLESALDEPLDQRRAA